MKSSMSKRTRRSTRPALRGSSKEDRELLVALHPHIVHCNPVNGGSSWASAQEGDECVDRGVWALRMNGHAAVVRVAHPARQAKLVGPTSRCISKADALDGTGDERSDRPRDGEAIAQRDVEVRPSARRNSSSARPSTRTVLSRERSPRTTLTRPRAIPARFAINLHRAMFA